VVSLRVALGRKGHDFGFCTKGQPDRSAGAFSLAGCPFDPSNKETWTVSKDVVKELGKRFGELFYTGNLDHDLGFPISSLSIQDAYRVQDEAIAFRRCKGEEVVGYKVGCTSARIRKQLRLAEPISGRLMSPHIYTCTEKTLLWKDYVNCAIEPELVICTGKDLAGTYLDDEFILGAIEYLSPGIEVHHFKFWLGDPTVQELIMSNGLFACLVVGSQKVKPDALDLRSEVFRVFVQGRVVTKGTSSEIMGGPLASLKWLLSHLAARGKNLKAGSIVIPGSPVELVRIAEDTDLTIDISKLGTVRIRFVS
jgi:2-keto-4-pentenoate hydratase